VGLGIPLPRLIPLPAQKIRPLRIPIVFAAGDVEFDFPRSIKYGRDQKIGTEEILTIEMPRISIAGKFKEERT